MNFSSKTKTPPLTLYTTTTTILCFFFFFFCCCLCLHGFHFYTANYSGQFLSLFIFIFISHSNSCIYVCHYVCVCVSFYLLIFWSYTWWDLVIYRMQANKSLLFFFFAENKFIFNLKKADNYLKVSKSLPCPCVSSPPKKKKEFFYIFFLYFNLFTIHIGNQFWGPNIFVNFIVLSILSPTLDLRTARMLLNYFNSLFSNLDLILVNLNYHKIVTDKYLVEVHRCQLGAVLNNQVFFFFFSNDQKNN